MDDPILQLLTRGVFILVFGLTLIDFLRWRDLARLEVAALFGSLVPAIALQAVTDLTGFTMPDWAATASVIAVLAQPYLQVRVLGQFKSVPTLQHVVALIGLLVSCGLWFAFGANLPTWGTVAIVVAFAYVEGYATVEFVRSALTLRGLTQRRLIAIASGSGCLATAVVLSGLTTALPSSKWLLVPLMDLLSLGSAIAYYVGMAPPAWLRRIWQSSEIRRFLIGLSGRSGSQRVESILEYLGPAAARATGGIAAMIALASDEHPAVLDLYADPRSRAALAKNDLETLTLERSPAIQSAWRYKVCRALGPADDLGWELYQVTSELDARGALVAPLTAGQHVYGVFIVFVNRASLFVADDLAVLEVLADQAAMAIESAKLLEESIRERSTLAAVMSSMHDGLLVMDSDGLVRYCNGMAAGLLGIDRDHLIGISAKDVFGRVQSRTVNAESVMGEWRRAMRDPEKHPSLEVEFTGPARTVHVELFTVAKQGVGRGLGVVLRDVTTERDLVRTKDELVSVVSHELRTPLASVVGFAELLRTRELAEPQRQQYLTVILEEGRRLTSLINDFLDLQRMESGRQEIAPRRLSLAGLLEESVQAAGPDALRPIELEVPEDLPAVRADSERIRQVMANLLSNARKYSPDGGAVEVIASVADGQVIVAVRDHGLGLPPEAVPRLFEKFYRVDNSDRRKITGTGLGLAISRKIIEAHGGRIWAESEGSSGGSRFSFSLPVADERSTSGDVLIVEDDAGFARLLEAELADRNISVVWAASAEEAIQQLARETPKALVLDLLLPGVQGESFLQTISQKEDWDVPVIVVTVKDLTQQERATMNRLKVEAILRKEPNVRATAADMIEAALRRQSRSRHDEGIAA